MPKGLLQEKFQRTVPDPNTDGGNEWATQESQRHAYDQPSQHYETSEPKKRYSRELWGAPIADFDSPKTNDMPPGMFIDNQLPTVNDHNMQYGPAGSTDVSNSVDGKMLRKGFQRQEMRGTDDMYTNEHVEEFYGEASGSDDAGNKYTGFLERNNYLDRN